MRYTEKQIKEIIERLNQYESTINTLLLKLNEIEGKRRRKVDNKKVVQDECIIHLSFSGLNRSLSLKDRESP